MKRSYLLFFFLVWCKLLGSNIYGKAITIPSKIRFANMQLYITAEVKEEIQKKITSLTRSPKHYKEIFDRINLYMPLIERILKEEGLPEDFKYLSIQESHLVADDISTSNAVGFWQFKQEGASEVGVRMDQYIDERMHIIASTRGFSKFVKRHHEHFQNWLYALLAFHLGRTGARNFIEEKKWHIQANQATIDSRVHWYIYHFIAHKIVFQTVLGKELHPELRLYEHHDCQGKTIHELSQQFDVPLPTIQSYNKWLKPIKIPEDATCSIIIPMTHQQYARVDPVQIYSIQGRYKINYHPYWNSATKFPDIKTSKNPEAIQINNLSGIIAQPHDNLASLARKGNMSLQRLLDFNDINTNHQVEAGQVYYFESKNSKAAVHYHIVRPQETWWSIAQKYGIKQSSLLCKNRVQKVVALAPGRVLWLRFIRPAHIPVAYLNEPGSDNNSPTTKITSAMIKTPSVTNSSNT